MTREAIILAGGYGTRLHDVAGGIPKPMVPVRNRPFLEYVLDYLDNQGVCKVCFALGYLPHFVSGHFGDRYKSLELFYSVEKEPLGTGGGVLLALSGAQEQEVFVLNGDSYFEADLASMYRFHQKKGADLSIALHYAEDTNRYGSVETDASDQVTGFSEKKSSKESGWINGGIYLLKRTLFEGKMAGMKFSLEKDLFPVLIYKSVFYGYKGKGYFIDIGTPESYSKAQDEFIRFEI